MTMTMTKSRLIAAVVALATGTLAAAAAGASVTFTDGTFTAGTYVPGFTFADGASLTVGQCASCGDPGAALELTITEPTGFSSTGGNNLVTGLVNSSFTYNPATQGAITSIDASIDKDLTATVPGLITFTNTFRPLIEQNGQFYTADIVGTPLIIPAGSTSGTTGYLSFSQSGLVAADFNQVDPTTGLIGTAHPDFSGAEITFGMFQILGETQAPSFVTYDYDNLSLTVNSVPEPATWTMLLVGFGGLGAMLRGARRRQAAATA
jgi:hypothetical protein